MRSQFDLQLSELSNKMISIGMLCETAISKASRALLNNDLPMAKELPDMLSMIAQQEREIEGICMKLLLHQQPVAKDLRTISSALKMVTDIQRIGTQSADIAEIVEMGYITKIPQTLPITEMASAVIKMVTDAIDSFVTQDKNLAAAVIKYDDIVDDLFSDCKSILIEFIQQPNQEGEAMIDLLMVAKYLERIGDHAVNIAKWVIFSVTGSKAKVE